MSNSRKRVLVTGGAGFVGSHLCTALLARGDEVVCLDNFQTGCRSNVAQLADHPAFTLIDHDIREPLDLAIDEIYNLACPASPVHYQSDPIGTLKTSVLGLLNLLDLARRCHAKLLQASTSEVYGDPLVHPQREDYCGNVNPIGRRACYDEGKRCAETLCFDFRRQFGVRTKVARIFNTYGPRMGIDDGRVVSNFLVQALQGEAITLYGDGRQTRSFCYVDDLVAGLLLLMATPDEVSGPVNLGNPAEITVAELAARVIALTGSRSALVYKPLPEDDPVRRRPDIARAKALLDWEPRIDLEEGLRRTADYFAAVLHE